MNPPFSDPTQRISQEDLNYIAHTQRSLQSRTGTGSAPSSRPSTSSTSGSATISLDPRALAQLSAHFDGLLSSITARVEDVRSQSAARGHAMSN